MAFHPSLEFVADEGIAVLTDRAAREHGVFVAFTTRDGGASRGEFASLNLSSATGDDPDVVAANRARVARTLGVDAELHTPHQVHGCGIVECDAGSSELGDADAVIARTSEVPVGVLTADCVPVLIWAEDGVAAVHAGWRGIVAGVVEIALDRMKAPRMAWIGPAIGACCYEVGPDVTSAFEERSLPIADPWHVDPAHAVAAQLRRAGVDDIAASGLCTSCDARFYSYRRDGLTGRQGGFISLS